MVDIDNNFKFHTDIPLFLGDNASNSTLIYLCVYGDNASISAHGDNASISAHGDSALIFKLISFCSALGKNISVYGMECRLQNGVMAVVTEWSSGVRWRELIND